MLTTNSLICVQVPIDLKTPGKLDRIKYITSGMERHESKNFADFLKFIYKKFPIEDKNEFVKFLNRYETIIIHEDGSWKTIKNDNNLDLKKLSIKETISLNENIEKNKNKSKNPIMGSVFDAHKKIKSTINGLYGIRRNRR